MNTDCAYVIGQSHQVCQDYARAGDGYAILSDGCSSSPDTDIGARLMVCAAEAALRKRIESRKQGIGGGFAEAVARLARGVADTLSLGPAAIDATLWAVYRHTGPGGRQVVDIAGWGDGTYAVAKTDGVIDIHSTAYTTNAPFYPAYLLDKERLTAWRRPGKSVRRTCWVGQAGDPDIRLRYDATNEWPFVDEDDDEEDLTADYVSPDRDEFFGWGFDLETVRFVAVFSDGVGSFTERTESGEMRAIPVGEIVRELIDFKSFKGAFVQRRMNAFLKQCAARGWKHHDDLSMAVIAMRDGDVNAD